MRNINKKRRGWNLLFATVSLILAVNCLVGYRVFAAEADGFGESEAFEKIRTMMRAMHLIRQNYVDEKKVDSYTTLIYNAMRGMAGSLDPFSGFMAAEELKDMMESTEGHFGGLGIRVSMRDNVLTVVAPMENSPGSRAGILAGDQIVEIEGKPTFGLSMQECVTMLKGAPGTGVKLTIRRPGREELQEMEIVREIIEVPSVKDARIISDNIAYVRVTQFNEPTAEDLRRELVTLASQSPNGLILDLRNNPGGLLDSAVMVSSLFLPRGKLVVSTEGRRESQKQQYHTLGGESFPRVPMVILINRGSASASEIVGGCLRDWQRAILIGEKTFGKGSVQNVLQLPDGSALRLTTAMYYTPSRRVIHENGIEPDIEVVLSDEEMRELIEFQFSGGSSADPDSIVKDRQLERAVEILKTYSTLNRLRSARFRNLPEPVETQ